MRPELYQYRLCPFCSKVSAMLEYKGEDYFVFEVNPITKKEISFSEDYRKVPIYVDRQSRQVNESNVIMKHIDTEFQNKPVFETDPEKQSREQEWLDWSESYVQGLPGVVYDSLSHSWKAFKYIASVGKFSWFEKKKVRFGGTLLMTMVAKKIRKKLGIKDSKVFLDAKFNEWMAGLEGQDFMGGTKPNAADIAVYGMTRILMDLPAGKVVRGHDAFYGWFLEVDLAVKADAKDPIL